jgi:hypothetical protein
MGKDVGKEVKSTMLSGDLVAQRDYVKKLEEQKFDFGLVFENAFVKGMRDIGYKSSGTALNELIDNSIQAEATAVHVIMGYESNNRSQKKPDMVAVIDNGHGMDPKMIRASVLWGGSHRADKDDRTGFGRYGYGLPSACVSMGQVYSVFSKTTDGIWNKVTIDLPAIGRGELKNDNGHVVAPIPRVEEPPEWILEYMKKGMPGMESGTVVLIKEIDRLSFWTTQKLREFLLQTFGVTYRNYLREVSIFVDEKKVEAIDPLFITEGCKFYDEDNDRAEALEPLLIEVKDKETKQIAGTVKVRFSYMPPTFLRVPEDKPKSDGRGVRNNNRFEVRKEHNGIIVLRAGRLIDVVNGKCPWTQFQNNDRYIGVEVDFPPVLDEEFSITTSKQQVVLSQRMWDILENNGVYTAIGQMRKRLKTETEAIKDQHEGMDKEKRPSEHAMEEVQKLLTRRPAETTEQKQKNEENLEREAKEKAKKAGIPVETVKRELELDAQGRPFRVEFVNHPGAPFYRVEQVGGQKVLFINRAHRFYSEIYASHGSLRHSRYGLEILLFVFGDCELRASPEVQAVYESERTEWSKYLNLALDRLSQWENAGDNQAADIEQVEAEAALVVRQANIQEEEVSE